MEELDLLKRKEITVCMSLEILKLTDLMAEQEGLNRSRYLEKLISREIKLRAKVLEKKKNTIVLNDAGVVEAVTYLATELGKTKEQVIEEALGITVKMLVAEMAKLVKEKEGKA